MTGQASMCSAASRPAIGEPTMLRHESPQAWMVERSWASSFSKISGTSCSWIQWSWMDWRVVQSQYASPNSGLSTGPVAYSRAISPTTRSCSGVRRPFGVPMRIMKYDSWPFRWWYSPHHLNRSNQASCSSSGMALHPSSANRKRWSRTSSP